MRRTILIFALIAALVATGCDPGGAKSAAVGSANGLGGDETSATANPVDAVAEDRAANDETGAQAVSGTQLVGQDTGVGPPIGEDPTPIIEETEESAEEETADPTEHGGSEVAPDPIEAAWTDGAELSAQSKLSFTVTNVTVDKEVAFTVSIVSIGVLGEGEKQIAETKLGPGESEAFSLSAVELPVRSDTVVSQMAVGIRRKNASSDWVGRRHLAAERFYRHAVGLGTVRAYTEETLMSELGGVLYDGDVPTAATMSKAALEAEVLGYKDDESGTAKPVSLAETGLVSYDDSGNVTGVTSQVGIGVGDASGEGAISVPEEDPTVDGPAEDEMEVADE